MFQRIMAPYQWITNVLPTACNLRQNTSCYQWSTKIINEETWVKSWTMSFLHKRFNQRYGHLQYDWSTSLHVLNTKKKSVITSVQNKNNGTLVMPPFNTGLNFLIMMLSFTFKRYLPPPPPMNSKSSLETFPHLAFLQCCIGANTWIPLNGCPVRADRWVCSWSLVSHYLAVYPT